MAAVLTAFLFAAGWRGLLALAVCAFAISFGVGLTMLLVDLIERRHK